QQVPRRGLLPSREALRAGGMTAGCGTADAHPEGGHAKSAGGSAPTRTMRLMDGFASQPGERKAKIETRWPTRTDQTHRAARSMTSGGRSSAVCPVGGRPPLRAYCGARGSEFEAHAFGVLQIGNDLEQVAGLRVATGTEHAHQTLGRAMGNVAQFTKADCSIDEVAQYDLAGFQITGKKVFDSLAEKRLAECRIAFYARSDGFLEIPCQSHGCHLPVPFRCL